MLEPGTSYLLGLVGLAITSASHASVIGALEPALVAALAWAVCRERLGPRSGVLMAVSLAGAVAVVGDAGGGAASVKGDVLVLAGVACAAGYVLVSSRQRGGTHPIAAALTQQVWVLGAVAVLVALLGLARTNRTPADAMS